MYPAHVQALALYAVYWWAQFTSRESPVPAEEKMSKEKFVANFVTPQAFTETYETIKAKTIGAKGGGQYDRLWEGAPNPGNEA